MGKNKKSSRQNAETTEKNEASISSKSKEEVTVTTKSLKLWLAYDRDCPFWISLVLCFGFLLGFLAGAGGSTFASSNRPPVKWRISLGIRIRSLLSFSSVQEYQLGNLLDWTSVGSSSDSLLGDPSHPLVFAILREAVIREKGGYVHHDLGFLVPAPSGAARGIGMVRDSFDECQRDCFPGVAHEKIEEKEGNSTKPFRQEEVLIRIPLGFQMTRSAALTTLTSVIPSDIQNRANLHELDDAALLVLFLAHERGIGQFSRWVAYIASLPSSPSCGYSRALRPHMLDAVNVLRDVLGVDVQGWESELMKATKYAEKISSSLASDYGDHLKTPIGMTPAENIEWALCQVASRATAGNDKHGNLRLIPILDLVNHDENAGGFVELTGQETLEDGDFVDATEDDSGSFVIRSIRHGRRKPLRRGQELLANYHVPQYTPLDWFISLGFVPPERRVSWEKVEPAFPPVMTD